MYGWAFSLLICMACIAFFIKLWKDDRWMQHGWQITVWSHTMYQTDGSFYFVSMICFLISFHKVFNFFLPPCEVETDVLAVYKLREFKEVNMWNVKNELYKLLTIHSYIYPYLSAFVAFKDKPWNVFP